MIVKAVIPIAGLGTRMLPVTAAVPKAMLPLVDSRGRIRSVLHFILAEARAAGVRTVALVVSPGRQAAVESYLAAAREGGADDLPEGVEYIEQPRPEGFGEAVLRAERFLGGAERFLLFLGDHVHVAEAGGPPCAAQVAEAFERFGGAAMIGMQEVGADELCRVGVARGEPEGRCGPAQVYRCTDFAEKPDAATAAARLATPGLAAGKFLAHCGIYAFTREILACLAELKAAGRRSGEIQLADAQSMLLARRPREYRLVTVAGRTFDTGTPAGYAEAFRRLSVV